MANRERLHLTVLVDTSLVYYAVFDTVRIEDGISQSPKRVYWFNDYQVKAGDHVILYSKPGTDVAKRRTDGATNHFFYWGLKNTLWGAKDACAVVVEVNDWETSP